MIAERRHTAIAIYTNGIGYLKALDGEEKRCSLSRGWLSRNPLSQHFSTLPSESNPLSMKCSGIERLVDSVVM